MDRRSFAKQFSVALAASAVIGRAQQQVYHATSPSTSMDTVHSPVPTGPLQQIGMLMYPGMTPLDLVGPHAFLSGLMNVEVHLLWKSKEPVLAARSNLSFNPTTTLEQCPRNLDVLFVPGGTPGTNALLQDDVVLDFLADRGSRARYVTSVCTGSLILGAAGLLKGFRVTSHWATRDLLPVFGAIPVEQRVVEDRNRVTGAGVTSGIDFGLLLAARMRDVRFAKMLQLANEYDPQPPFQAGTPAQAGPELTQHLERMMAPGHDASRQAALDAVKRRNLA